MTKEEVKALKENTKVTFKGDKGWYFESLSKQPIADGSFAKLIKPTFPNQWVMVLAHHDEIGLEERPDGR